MIDRLTEHGAGSLHVLSDIPVQVPERALLRAMRIPRLQTLDDLPEADLREQLRDAVVRGLSLAEPRATVRWLALPWAAGDTGDGVLAPPRVAGHIFQGASVRRWFAGCRRVTLMVVTIGAALDHAVRALEHDAIGRAFHLDTVGSVLVESAVDAVDADISKAIRKAGFEPTRRRSAGYGDWSLDAQPAILRWCDARRIEVGATEAHVLRPSKSVTAAIGWRDEEGP